MRNTTDKATHSQLRQHNQQLVLRAVYQGIADNRAALAQETGLAKPTVSELVEELIADGILIEEGRGQSTESGGKRPRLLKFLPTARHVIGVSVNEERVLGELAFLDGEITAQHYIELAGAQGRDVIELLKDTINGLTAQLDAPLLCVGIGVPGMVADGTVSYAPQLGWHNVPLAALLCEQYAVPVYVANSTELIALAQYVYGPANHVGSFASVRIGGSVGVGLVFKGTPYHGGGEIGHLRVAEHSLIDTTADRDGRLETFLSWPYVKQRVQKLRSQYPKTMLPIEDLTYLHIRYAALHNDPAALELQEEISFYLAQVFAWIIGLLRPNHISLAGPIAEMGQDLLDRTIDHTQQRVLPDLVQQVTFSLAEASNWVAVGAIAQALQLELGLV
jgi:predicted NBD/HSP70 family sugar kinase